MSSLSQSTGSSPYIIVHIDGPLAAALVGIREKSTAGVILPLGESDCLDWSSDKDDILGLA